MLRESHFDKATIFWRNIELSVVKEILQFRSVRLVLDLGCGEGEVAREVFGKRLEWGLDNDKEMVKKAKKSGIYKKVLFASALKIPLKDVSVGMVFSNSVLEHIKDIERVLDEAKRVLRPGGLLVFTVPTNKLSEYLGWGKWYARIFNRKYNHYHLYSLSKWKQILKKHGFEVIRNKEYLSMRDIRYWHKLLWVGRLPRLTFAKAKLGRVKGAGLAIVAEKL